MSEWSLDAPVAFFLFNRPEKTTAVFERIAAVEPPKLLVIADGPRDGHPEDDSRCEAARTVVDENLDWSCDLRRNYAEENLGILERFTTGLKWIFNDVNEAIILEDDCVPNRSFFRFCERMLERYRNDERIMDITGQNVVGEWGSSRQDYHFSHFGGVWGWATWRRSWELYDPDMELWSDPRIRERLRDVIADRKQFGYLKHIYQLTYDGDIETWDYQWRFAKNINSALTVVPSKNLVTNIGFDREATNTTTGRSDLAEIERHQLEFPIREPDYVAVDRDYDREFFRRRPFSQRNALLRFGRNLYRHLNR